LVPQSEPPLNPDPTWPEERVFREYLARLKALQKAPGTAASIADFRRANGVIEAQLRASLPHLIKQTDAIYVWAATNAV
jgi:hypothetical protein